MASFIDDHTHRDACGVKTPRQRAPALPEIGAEKHIRPGMTSDYEMHHGCFLRAFGVRSAVTPDTE